MYPWGWYGISMVSDAALQTALISVSLNYKNYFLKDHMSIEEQGLCLF